MFLEYGRKRKKSLKHILHVEDREKEDDRYLLNIYFLTMTARLKTVHTKFDTN